MKRGSSAKFQKLGGAMAPAGPPPAPPFHILSLGEQLKLACFVLFLLFILSSWSSFAAGCG